MSNRSVNSNDTRDRFAVRQPVIDFIINYGVLSKFRLLIQAIMRVDKNAEGTMLIYWSF